MADENLERITILLQARDRDFARAMDRNNRLIARLNRDAQRNTSQMSRVVNSRLDDMARGALAFGRSFAAGIAGGVVATAFGMLTTNLRGAVQGIAAFGDQARRAGVGVEEFQQWGYVAEQNRIPIDAMIDGFKELNLRADEFVTTGAGPAAEAFSRMGFGADDLARRLEDPSALMLEIVDRLQQFDTAAQIRIADEVFGGTAGERFVELLAQGEAGLRRTMERAREVGAVMSEEMVARADEIDRRFSEIAAHIGQLGRQMVVGWAIAADAVIDALTTDDAERALADARAEMIAMQGEARDMQSVMGFLADEAERLGDAPFANAFRELSSALDLVVDGFESGQMSADQFRAYLDRLTSAGDRALGAVQSIDGVTLDAAGEVVDGLRARLANLAAEAAAAAEQVRQATMTEGTPFLPGPDGLFMPPTSNAPLTSPRPPRAPALLGEPDAPGSGSGTGSRASGYAAAVEQIRERTAALEAEAAALVMVAASGQQYGDAVEYARRRAELLTAAQREGRAITPELTAEIDALAAAYVAAGQSAEDAAQRMQDVQAQTERGIDAMTGLFEGLLQGGDAARAAVARLIAEIARMQMMRAFQGLVDGGGGGFFNLVGGLLSGRRAGGGPVSAGGAYLVNENTPNSEIFVPSRSGGVLNVSQAKDALRGQGQQVHVTVSAVVDERGTIMPVVQSVVQRATPGIVRQAVGATYQSFREVRPQ